MKKISKFLAVTACIVAIGSVFATKKVRADGCSNYCGYNPNYACVIGWPAGNTTTCYYSHSKAVN